MKKVALPIIIILIILGLAGPKFSGNIFHNELERLVQKLNDLPGYQAEISNKNQSWFSSNAEILVSFEMGDAFNQSPNMPDDLSFSIPIDVQHGPFLTQSGLAFGWAEWQINLNPEDPIPNLTFLDDVTSLYSIKGIVGLFGNTIFSDYIPALTYTDESNGAVYSQTKWEGSGYFSSSSIIYDSVSPLSIDVTADGESIADIDNIAIQMSVEEGVMQIWEQLLYNSHSIFSIESINVTDAVSDNEVALNNISIAVKSTYDENTKLGDFLVSTKAKKVITDEFTLEDMQLDYSINKISQPFVIQYQSFMDDMLNNPENAEVLIQDFLQTSLLQQLQTNPEFNLPAISATINGSKLEGFINTTLQGVESLPNTFDDQAFWMQHMLVNAELNAQEEAVKFIASASLKSQLSGNPQFQSMTASEQEQIIQQQVDATLANFMQNGMLNLDEDGYSVLIKLENAELFVNGQQIPL